MTGRWRIALAGALVVVVALVTGAGPRTGPTPADPAPTPAPQGLVSGLQALDQKISQTIQKVENNELKGSELEKAAGALRDDLYKLLVDYFPPVFGLPFYKVFNGFLGIDSYINNTAWWAAGNQEKTTSEKDKAVASIDHAKAELKGLQDELTGSGASGVPPALLKGLKHLNEGLTTAAQRARAGSLKLTELSDLNYEKRHLIRDNTQGISLFGQPFAHVEYELESVAYALERVQYGVPFGTTPHKNTAASALRGARYNKEILEDTVVQPVVSISATFYAKGASGACEDTQSDPNFGETCYSVSATPPNAETQLEYRWSLAPPVQDSPPVTNPNPGCVKFHPLPNKAKMFLDAVWHHGDEDGCNHMVEGP